MTWVGSPTAPGRRIGSQEVGRALDSEPAAVEEVGVDHGGLDGAVAEELLDVRMS